MGLDDPGTLVLPVPEDFGFLHVDGWWKREWDCVTTQVYSSKFPWSALATGISTTVPSIEDDTCAGIDIAPRTNASTPSSKIETRAPSVDAADAPTIVLPSVDDPDGLVCPLPKEVRLSNVGTVVETGLYSRINSGPNGHLGFSLADHEESEPQTDAVVASLGPDWLSAEMGISTMELSIEDGTCTDINITPSADASAPFSHIKTGDPPIDAADAKAIGFIGVDDPDALVFSLPEEVGL